MGLNSTTGILSYLKNLINFRETVTTRLELYEMEGQFCNFTVVERYFERFAF